jgi:hypothetical protein
MSDSKISGLVHGLLQVWGNRMYMTSDQQRILDDYDTRGGWLKEGYVMSQMKRNREFFNNVRDGILAAKEAWDAITEVRDEFDKTNL